MTSAAQPAAWAWNWWRRGRIWAPLLLILFGALTVRGANSSFSASIEASANLLACGALFWAVRNEAVAVPRAWMASAMLFLLALVVVWAELLFSAPPQAARELAALASAHGGSILPDATPVEVAKLLGLAGLVVAVALAAADLERAMDLIWLLQACALVYTLVALALFQSDPVDVLGGEKAYHWARFTGTLLNANVAGAIFALFGALGAGLLRRQLSELGDMHPVLRRSRYPLLTAQVLVILLFVGACALTRSRIALGGLGIALGFMAWRALPQHWRGRKGREQLRAVQTVAPLAALALVAWLGREAFTRADLGADFQGRVDGLRYILHLTREAPLGFGLGSFRAAFEHELPASSAPVIWNYGAAHNALLQAALEGGWLFAALIVASLACLVWPAMRAPAPRGARSIKRSLAVGLLLIAGISLTDIVLNVPAAATLWSCLLGVYAASAFWWDPARAR
jgi:hypothetical protein